MNTVWKETLLSFLRVVVLAILPVILMGLDQSSGEITINWRVVGVVGLVALLKAVDEFLHSKGKYVGDESLKKGLTRF